MPKGGALQGSWSNFIKRIDKKSHLIVYNAFDSLQLENKRNMAKKTHLLSDRLIFRSGDFVPENRTGEEK